MNDWLKQVKDDWNQISDSAWYQSLRSDEKIAKLVREPTSAFHPAVYHLIKKYIRFLYKGIIINHNKNRANLH